MKRGIVLKAFAALFAVGIIVAVCNIAAIYLDTSKTEDLYQSIETEYIKPKQPPKQQETPETEQDEIKKEPQIEVDFLALTAKNKEVVGWLYLPNSKINYPVVQAEDNDKYLHRDLYGKKLSAGTLFVDFRNTEIGTEPNYIIYGHNMKNGTMFKTLINYKVQSFFDNNPVMYYLTPNKNYKIELVAGVVIPSNDDIYDISQSRDSIFGFIEKSVKSSTFKSSVKISKQDNFITLSTCSYEYENARFAVIGRITEAE